MFDNALQLAGNKSLQVSSSTIAEQCLQAVSDCAPVLRETLAKYGNIPLAEYLDTLKPSPAPPLQSRQDFIDIYRQEVTSLLGESIGEKAAEEMACWPMVLTANHLGVDFFSQSVQSSLLFFLLKRRITPSQVVIPIIACGSVPLNNVTYPLGVLLYKLTNGPHDKIPRKLPIFANKIKRTLVSAALPFDKAMVERAQNRLAKMVVHEEIDPLQAGVLQQIFEQDYDAPGVMDLGSYSRQSLVVNNRIWQRLFATEKAQSHIATLDMEAIVTRLLEGDLNNKKSLVWSILLDPDLRNRVLERLDNKRACWNLSELRQRLDIGRTDAARNQIPASSGTVFFWGVDARSQRIPLLLVDNGENRWALKGADDKGKVTEITFSVDAILSALRSGQLLPSIFTSYTVLAFARGLTCLGGYYQAEYLPRIQKELVTALRDTGSYHEEARLVEGIETSSYLSGMQTVMAGDTNGLIPAGPIEIIAGGGLSDQDLDQILSLSVRDAHLASLFETVDDIAPLVDEKRQLKQALAKYCLLLRNKVVVK
ncbi:MAG: hypothetical protein GY799_15010 [Desulfobulbaceae bacterium]|nr:hypothetical protein [Desulfobulbaceae bacterium]